MNRDFRSSDGVPDHKLGMAADGTAVAVWERFDLGKKFKIEGAQRPPGGEWSQPTLIARTKAEGGAGLGDVFVDGMGNVSVAFRDRVHADKYPVSVRTWRSDGSLEPAVKLARGSGPRLFGDRTGDLMAVVDSERVFTRPFGEPWREIDRLPSDFGGVLAVGPGSSADVVWRDLSGIQTAALDGDTWGPTIMLAPDRRYWNSLVVVRNSTGDTGVLWEVHDEDEADDDLVESVFRPAGSTQWGPVERVNPGPESVDVAVDSTEAGMAEDGTIIATWREADRPHQYGTHLPILSATRAPTDGWSEPQQVGLAGRFLGLNLSVNASGDASLFAETRSEVTGLRWLASAQRSADTEKWSTSRFTQKLDYLYESFNEVDGVLSDGGEATAVFQKTEEAKLRSRTNSVS